MDEDTLKPGDIVMLDPDYARIVNKSKDYKLASVEHWLTRDKVVLGVKYKIVRTNDSGSVVLEGVNIGFNHPGMIFLKVNDSVEHEDNLINIWNNQ